MPVPPFPRTLRALATALALCAGLALFASSAAAQSWLVDEEDDAQVDTTPPASTSVRGMVLLGGGWAYTPRTNDPPGAIRLVGGSAFPGTTLRLGGGLLVPVHGPLSLHLEAGLQRTVTEGYAELEEPTGNGTARYRRELSLQLLSLDAIGLLRLTHTLSPTASLWLGAGLGMRAGVHGRAEERRIGFFDSEPAPRIRLAPALILPVEVGASLQAGPVAIPLAVRAQFNPGYGNTTAGRLDGAATLDDPGRYWVESAFQLLFLTGVVF